MAVVRNFPRETVRRVAAAADAGMFLYEVTGLTEIRVIPDRFDNPIGAVAYGRLGRDDVQIKLYFGSAQ